MENSSARPQQNNDDLRKESLIAWRNYAMLHNLKNTPNTHKRTR